MLICVDLNYAHYEGISKIFRTDAVKIIKTINKCVRKLPTPTQLRATWHIVSLDMVVLPSTDASRYHNCCIDGSTSLEYFEYSLVKNNECGERRGGICSDGGTTENEAWETEWRFCRNIGKNILKQQLQNRQKYE
jgi:hypothetical protein